MLWRFEAVARVDDPLRRGEPADAALLRAEDFGADDDAEVFREAVFGADAFAAFDAFGALFFEAAFAFAVDAFVRRCSGDDPIFAAWANFIEFAEVSALAFVDTWGRGAAVRSRGSGAAGLRAEPLMVELDLRDAACFAGRAS